MITDPFNIPLEQRLISLILPWRAETENRKTFIEVDNKSWSFSEVNLEVQALSKGLKRLGLNPQESVALLLPNCIEMIFSWFSCSLLRAINIPINPALVGDMLAKPFKDSKTRFLIIHNEFKPQLATLNIDILKNLEYVIIVGGICNINDLPEGPKNYITFDSLLIREGKELLIEGDYRDIQTIFYTSGTTGPAKGVQTLNAHQFSAACGFAKAVGLNNKDILFTAYPLFHGLAARLGVLPCLLVGAKVVIDSKFSAKNFWQKVFDCKATVAHSLFSTPRLLLDQPINAFEKLHSLRAMFNSHYSKEFEERFNVKLIEGFSMTETGFLLYTKWPERKEGSSGKAHEDWEVALFDEFDSPVPIGKVGEMVARPKLPYIMMQGYLNQPQATVEAFRNLWFHTGDLMRQDMDGYFFYVDRTKERIRRRGENISSFDIEQIVGSHLEIDECVAIPLQKSNDDDIRLLVVRKNKSSLTEMGLYEWLENKLPKYMLPNYIEFFTELPHTPTNKVEKVKLIKEGLSNQAWRKS